MLKIIRKTVSIQRIFQNSCRTLYSSGTLGIDGYIAAREKVKNQFINNETKFRTKMNEYVEDKSHLVFTEDLKNMVHLANENDIDLIIKMIKKFNTQNKELQFGNYIFGPVVMRMFYYLNAVDPALKCIEDEDLNGFFDYVKSFQILLDMLFNEKRYQEILRIYDLIKERPIAQTKTFRYVTTLTFAACYKMKSHDSFEYCLKLWHELHDRNIKPMRRVATFAAGLALEMNSPHIALEIISTVRDQQYLTVRNIKVQAYADLNRPEDALPTLRSVLEIDDPATSLLPTTKRMTFIRDVIDRVKESIKRNNKHEIETDFIRVEKFLNDNKHISDQSMDDILCTIITETYPDRDNRGQGYLAATFSRDNPTQYRARNNFQRRGLQDLY